MIALDSEVTGLDIRHGARPFFVTICDESGNQVWWEWGVDPLTREPQIPDGDTLHIEHTVCHSQGVVGQNCKFDVAALSSIRPSLIWPWDRTDDTLLAGHLLASNQPHDLTSMALHYLGVDIQPLEDALEQACNECRRLCRSHFSEWKIAKAGLPEMPSAKEKCWKYDTWLPRAIAQEQSLVPTHPYWTVLRDYANADSAVTIALWKGRGSWHGMEEELKRRDLWSIYLERRKLLKIVYEMESKGVTLSESRLHRLQDEYHDESTLSGFTCLDVAEYMGYKLEMPKGASPNSSLRTFMFDILKVPPMRGAKSKTNAPTLDKGAMSHYSATLPEGPALTFVRALLAKRARDTSLSYLEGYTRFWQPMDRLGEHQREYGDWFVLYPHVNITGTSTLRFSYSDPNLQNVSTKEDEDNLTLRYCYGPAPGREWWTCDAKNIELRIPAYEAGEEAMIALFERPDEPPYYGSNHLLNFHAVYPDLWDEMLVKVGFERVGPACKESLLQWYKKCKNGGFALQYGGQDETVDRAFGKRGARKLLAARFSKLHGKGGLNERCIAFAEKYGYIETIPDRTVNPQRGYPLMCTRTEWGKILPTVPLNYHIQGCLAGSSRVLTSDGLIPIQELEGKSVQVWTGERWAEAVGLNRGLCRRVTIKLESGLTVECDTRHKLKDEFDEWIEFRDLKVGGYVALPRNSDPLLPSPTINWWFILGYIIGDGALSNRQLRRKSLELCGGKTKHHILSQIYDFLAERFTGRYYLGRIVGIPHWRIEPALDQLAEKYHVSIENPEFAKFLESAGVSFDWRYDTKRIPESVWRASLQDQRDFLEGLWMSDGTRAETSGAGHRLNMTNPQLLVEVQVLASAIGYDSSVGKGGLRFRWRAFNSKPSRGYPSMALAVKVERLYKSRYPDAKEHTTDKRNLALAMGGKDVSQYVAERILRRNTDAEVYRYDRIVAIEVHDYEETTYTMSVNDPLHQFVADGVIHKNTAMWWMAKAMVRCQAQLDEWNNQLPASYPGTYRRTPSQYFMVLQVHDELCFDFPKGSGPEPWMTNLPRIRKLQRLMAQGGEDIGVPTPVSCSYHSESWADGKEM